MKVSHESKNQAKSVSANSGKRTKPNNILTSLRKLKTIFSKKNYKVNKIYFKQSKRKLTFAINFSDIDKRHLLIPLPKYYHWESSDPSLSEHFDEIVYTRSIHSIKKELKVLVDEFSKWVKTLPKLVYYHITILPLELPDAQEAENIFNEKLKFDMVAIEPADAEDERFSDLGDYYLEAIKYVPEPEEKKFEKIVEDIVHSHACFSSIKKMYRS